MPNIIDQLYQLRSSFIVIGLTGRTGSGCSTISSLLSKESFEEFNAPQPERGQNITNDARKYRITYNYLEENWEKFTIIKASDIITLFVVNNDYSSLREYFKDKTEIYDRLTETNNDDFKKYYNEVHDSAKNVIEFIKGEKYKQENNSSDTKTNQSSVSDIKKVCKFLFEDLPKFSFKLKEHLYGKMKNKSFEDYQKWGDNIRLTGAAFTSESANNTENNNKLSTLTDYINSIIKIVRKNNLNKKKESKDNKEITRIIIDALRNPYEILYFRERYSGFYTISVNTEDEDRKSRLFKIGFNEDAITELDKKEYPRKDILKDTYAKQQIQKCIELSDIHIVNPNDEGEDNAYLKRQLVHYISLMTHPGIVQPTPVERSMQIAYTAKLNSGCISRQVGAAITDEQFSLKSIGWNNTPEGQTPCSMRNFKDILSYNDKNAYSKYELSDLNFRNTLKNIEKQVDRYVKKQGNSITEILKGRNFSYCFKDIQNALELKKNQVYTRSLHAEENAFLQISKYGGLGLTNGKLFTTASPCELCAKKAYQIGIKEIYYIDPYPGISLRHILSCGTQQPQLILFEGAIGRAYSHLYNPILMHKDEISYLLDINMDELNKNKEDSKPQSGAENKLKKAENKLKKTKNKLKEIKNKLKEIKRKLRKAKK